MTDEIRVCPECDSAKLSNRVGSGGWQCQNCRSKFNEAETREPITRPEVSGLPKRLIEMNPDDLPLGGSE